MKKTHPALAFEKAILRKVQVGSRFLDVWMAPSIDTLLEDFIAVGRDAREWHEQRCPFGAVLWPSARALWQWLNEGESRFESIVAKPSDHDCKMIELGCGVGFLSALMAAKTAWKITATDYEPAYEKYVAENTRLHSQNQVQFETLDWCEALPSHLKEQFDLVVACDVFYDDSHLHSLPAIAAKLLKPTGSLLLADPERFRFTTALESLSKHFEQMTINQLLVNNSPDEAEFSGVVNPGQKLTRVHIIHCQIPRI